MPSRIARLTGIAIALLLSVTTFAQAQAPAPVAQAPASAAQAPAPATFPTFDVTLGYQFLHTPDTNFPFGLNLDGAWNLSSMFGLVAEGGWTFKTEDDLGADVSLNVWNFGVGPRLTARPSAKVQPYGQVLVGALYARASVDFENVDVSESDTQLMFQPGVGVNVVAGDGWGIVGAVDYRRVILDEDEDGESGENQFRVFVGIRMILD